MIIDGLLQFDPSPGTAVTTGTITSANILDLSVARDLGIGDDPALKVLVVITAAFSGGTNVNVQFQGAPDNGSGSPGTWATFAESGPILTANLLLGKTIFRIDVPRTPYSGAPLPRFYRLAYVVSGTYTLGTVQSYIVLDREDQVHYPPGIVIAN